MARDRWLRVGQVAELLGVSDEAVYRRARARRLTYYRDGRVWRFSLASVEAYLRERTHPARPVLPTIGAPGRVRRAAAQRAAPSADTPWAGSIFGRRDGAERAGPAPAIVQATRSDRPHAMATTAPAVRANRRTRTNAGRVGAAHEEARQAGT